MATDFRATLNLREAAFPMRASLRTREPARIAHWQQTGLYERVQARRAGAPAYVLHDGPPFTNGDVHIGTALNKTLKDIILRFKTMRGYRTPYVPGWDCHGLPIEFRVARELQEKGQTLPPAELRDACAASAEKFIGIQRRQFQRLGILADWAREYRTKDPAYEADILRTFARFVDQGLVYRSKRPVYWSIPCETALAEAEVEYRDHVAPSIFVRFPVANPAVLGLPAEAPLSAVIWTTTPWTLPANLAIAVHPDVAYTVVQSGEQRYLVAVPLVEAFAREVRLPEGWTTAGEWPGRDLVALQPQHPFIARPSPIVLADYVTTDSGTGLVHTAPGHGLEDYQTGLKHGLEIYCPLDDQGRYLDDGKVPARLVGKSVLEPKSDGHSQANDEVLAILRETSSLLRLQRYEHQYPHCWRSKTPVIFRAMDQWFVGLDQTRAGADRTLREEMLAAVGQVQWLPGWGENRIKGAIAARPDWCVSRQRAWGVPIPAFFTADNRAWLTGDLIRAIADKVARHGSNVWFAAPASELLEGVPVPTEFAGQPLRKGGDTLDVWIDSGSSHRCVLASPAYADLLHWPADLYLEGSDQHRGWFQSSLWTAVVANGAPPFRQVVTHGFIVNPSGEKESKSKGAKSAEVWADDHGADVLRLWVSSQDFRDDIPLSAEIFGHVEQTYRLLRNTLRFQLSNLYDFDLARDALPVAALRPVDRWALHQAAVLAETCNAAYEALEFHRVYQAINRFCASTLSAFYHDLLKDRLYTSAPTSEARRSAQTALWHVFDVLHRVLAPILVFTADEAHSYATAGQELSATASVHLTDFPAPPAAWRDEALAADFDLLQGLREQVLAKLQALRNAKDIGQSLEAVVTLTVVPGSPEAAVVGRYASALAELWIVSEVRVEEGAALAVAAVAAKALGYVKCPRCWKWYPELQSTAHGELCGRCAEALTTTVA